MEEVKRWNMHIEGFNASFLHHSNRPPNLIRTHGGNLYQLKRENPTSWDKETGNHAYYEPAIIEPFDYIIVS